ncbi:unnamed protein product [Linum trigynum]|uniref:RRM domain-containing protein n=1 Tax=Linum trigynum TaxID=586398 RepID=A0AAV2E064_9ROSI
MSRTLHPPLLTRNRKKKARIRQPKRARWLPTPPPKMGMMQLRRMSRRRTPKCSSGKHDGNYCLGYVGNLPYDVDSEKLAMLFEQDGTVEIVEVIYNRETDSSRGFGFVTMSTVEEAEKAVDKFNSYDMGGRFLTVNKAAPRGSRPERAPRVFEPGCRVYVGNLPWSVDDSRLEQVFSEHGKVTNARVVYDRDSGRSRGFGFVTMADETEMNDAIAALDGQSLDGKWFPERELEFN